MKKKEKLSEFAKYIKEKNLAFPLEKAFEINPVEEEWHKGNPDSYYLKDSSEFIKTIFANERVKSLNKYYEDNEDEGNYLLICESPGEYTKGRYKRGDIVFVKKYKYKDGAEGLNHLFVIVDDYNVSVPFDIFSMIISSNLDKLKYPTNLPLSKDNKNNLAKDSIVKIDYIYQVLEKNIARKMGEVDLALIDFYKDCYEAVNVELFVERGQE